MVEGSSPEFLLLLGEASGRPRELREFSSLVVESPRRSPGPILSTMTSTDKMQIYLDRQFLQKTKCLA